MFLTVLTAVLFSLFSTAVLGYISVATPIGPFIAPTLVLIASLFMPIIRVFSRSTGLNTQVMLAVAGGSVGGMLATAIGFSFPTLRFLDVILFDAWMAQPVFFIGAIFGLSLSAGLLGLLIADFAEHRMLVEQQLAFPVGELSYKMIVAQQQARKAYQLLTGLLSSFLFSVLQSGITFCKEWIPDCFTHRVIPESLTLMNELSIGVLTIPTIKFDLMPVYWAIGFITGIEIMAPLFLGAVLKFVVADTINHVWFADLSSMNFMLAFASGMVVAGALSGLVSTPQMLYKAMKKWWSTRGSGNWKHTIAPFLRLETVVVAVVVLGYLTYFHFTLMQQIYLVLFTTMCAYQIMEIAGKIGLAQLGRFATFVMVPALFLFNLNPVQITLIATFVEICCGVAVDVMFSRKMAQLGGISNKTMRWFQLLGLVVSSLAIGVVFWFLCKRFGLGSPEFFAQRAQSRALLVQSGMFNYWVLGLGFVTGYILKWLHINPMWVLGGLLMPLNITLGLSTGAVLTKFTKTPDEWHPFWSGIFAAGSLWMVIKAFV